MLRSIWRARFCLATAGTASAALSWATTEAETASRKEKFKYLVAGSGTAAHAACEVLAKEDPSASLLIVAPWWGGDIPGGTLAAGNRLVALDTRNRIATLSGGSTVSFERALLAVGGDTPLPPVGSVVAPNAVSKITGCRSAAERVKALRVLSEVTPPNRAHFTVVGGGWVALSAGVELLARGADVTFLYAEPALLARHLPKYLSVELRRRLRYMSDAGADYLAYAAIRHVAVVNDEAVVHAGVIFDPLADVVFRSDHVVLAPTYPPAGEIKSDELELSDGAFVTNRELSVASDIYAAGVCAAHPKAMTVRWSDLFAWRSGIHAARNMMGAREVFQVPRYSVVRLSGLKTMCTVVGDADGSCETLGYFNVPKDVGDETCGGILLDGVVFFLEAQRMPRGGCTFGIVGAVIWNGSCDGDEIVDEDVVEEVLAILDAEPRERNVIESELDAFAKKRFGISRNAAERREDVGRVLWRRHVAARGVKFPKEERLWMEDFVIGKYTSAEAEKAEAYTDLLRRSAGLQ